jgi:hypothetical protein
MDNFKAYLNEMDRSPHMIKVYLQGMRLFVKWFDDTYQTQLSIA